MTNSVWLFVSLSFSFPPKEASSPITLFNSTCEISSGKTSCVDEEAVRAAIQNRRALYDRNGDFHYDLISALHKSLRGGGGQFFFKHKDAKSVKNLT